MTGRTGDLGMLVSFGKIVRIDDGTILVCENGARLRLFSYVFMGMAGLAYRFVVDCSRFQGRWHFAVRPGIRMYARQGACVGMALHACLARVLRCKTC